MLISNRSTSMVLLFVLVFLFYNRECRASGSHRIMITELMAVNGSGLQDEDGDYSDWIELYNPGEQPINLHGWALTDNPSKPGKWKFPVVVLNPGQYLIVFASEKNRSNPAKGLHTNFKLSGSGEYLALFEPDMKTISFSFDDGFPVQQSNVSYGWFQGYWVYFKEPTPGTENASGSQLLEPVFSQQRGFYKTPFQVALQSPQEGLDIYYTTNGTRPNQTTGIRYTEPILIAKTTPLSVVVCQEGKGCSTPVSHTYIFTDDVVNQPAQPEGYPSEWSPFKFTKKNAPADYEMDPDVCQNPLYKPHMESALKAVPTVSVVTNIGYLFTHTINADSGGIYIYTGNTNVSSIGLDWERPVSMEYIDPVSGSNFQLNCGLRLHGGNSRVPENSQKHSFRLSFRSDYGPSKLKYNLFETRNPTNEFNSLVLRAGYNYSWTKNDPTQRRKADYLRDPFAKNTQLDMGHPSAHNKFVHLYLNGLYWGLYNISEKITNDFMEEYMGGTEEDWDVVKDHGGVVDGKAVAWNSLVAMAKADLSQDANYQKLMGNNSNGSRNPDYENLLDVDNLIDYMILNIYIGNKDWDGNNWLAARNRVDPQSGFRLFAWDAETSMIEINENIVNINNSGNPSAIFSALKKNKEFVVRLGDRLQKHFFNGGALTNEATLMRYKELADEIDVAIIAESARWGDYRKDVHPSDSDKIVYTRNDHWLVEVQNQINNYLPQRSSIVLNQFRNAGLFPTLEAPLFSHGGGMISASFDLTMTAKAGDIYYTTDGSDPREAGGAIALFSAKAYKNALRVNGSGTIKARAKLGNNWSPLTEATFMSNLPGGFILSNEA